MINRPLEFYEAVHANLNMCLVLFVDGKMTKKEIDQAWYLTQLRHPFLRMELVADDNAEFKLRFQERLPVRSIPDQQFRSEIGPVTGGTWQSTLEEMVNLPRVQCPATWYVRLRSNPKLTRHQLFFLFNHSGSDGPGVFAFVVTFMNFLQRVLANAPIPDVESLDFLALGARIPPEAAEVPSFQPTAALLPALKGQSSPDPATSGRFSGTYFEFGKRKTKNFITACKKHGASVQAVFTCAEMVAVAMNSLHATPLPHHFAPCILVDLRKYVTPPIGAGHAVCGSSGQIVEQDLRPADSLWGLIRETTGRMKAGLASNYPLKYRVDRQFHPERIRFTFMGSSVGRFPTWAGDRRLRLRGAKVIAGAYDGHKAGDEWTIAHAYTVQDRFNVTFSYVNPTFSPAWAARFAKIMESFLTAVANDKEANQSVAQFITRMQEAGY